MSVDVQRCVGGEREDHGHPVPRQPRLPLLLLLPLILELGYYLCLCLSKERHVSAEDYPPSLRVKYPVGVQSVIINIAHPIAYFAMVCKLCLNLSAIGYYTPFTEYF